VRVKNPRKYKPHKPQTVPAKFQVGFLSTLDGRTDLAKALRTNYQSIIDDIGEQLSHVKTALVERFVWLEAVLQTLEHEMANGQTDKADALGRWTQSVNSLLGLARVLGIERSAKKTLPWIETPPHGASTKRLVANKRNHNNDHEDAQD